MFTRRRLTIALAALPTLSVSGLRADDKKAEDGGDLKALEGVWTQDADGHENTWTFKGTNCKRDAPTRKYDMTMTLDAKATPKSVDFKTDKGPEDAEGKTLKAIYKLDGDKLTICLGVMEDRPKEFKQEEGSTFVFELKRKK